MSTTEVFKRSDGLWAWRLRASNGQIIATDGGQGYSRRRDAVDMAERINVAAVTGAEEEAHE